jgi:asparagine synthase (glutamine-hydrolysing)
MRGKNSYHAFVEAIRLFDKTELTALGVEEYDAKEYWKGVYTTQLTNAQQFDLSTVLPYDFFMKADKMSSAFGLEQRVPFMDHNLVELTFQFPSQFKLNGWKEKHVLKEAFKELLPEEIVKRKKHGFDVPIDYWFKNVLAETLRNLLETRTHDLYNKTYILHLLDDIQKRGDNHKLNFLIAQKLWSILVFELWYKRFIDA